jgi:hypothetical protein
MTIAGDAAAERAAIADSLSAGPDAEVRALLAFTGHV